MVDGVVIDNAWSMECQQNGALGSSEKRVLVYSRGVGTGGATGARAPLVLQQAKLTYKAYVGLSLRDPVGSADHMAQGVCDARGIATQYSYIIVRHYLEL